MMQPDIKEPVPMQAVKDGVRIEILTLIAVVIEASVSLAAGIAAGSALLIAFGLDSIVELITASVLLWRLRVESSGAEISRVENAEKKARRIVAVCLALLCLYVLATSLWGLWAHVSPEGSYAGIAVSLFAAVVMPYLAIKKRRIGTQLHSHALLGDAACSMTCAYMALTVLVGLLLTSLFGWWWAQHVAGLVFLYYLVQETKDSFKEEHSH